MVRHENRGEEIKEEKKNVVGAKPKVSKPHSLSRDKKVVKMIQISSRKPPFSRQTLSHEQPK
jgi:hypothetical protein